MENYSIRIDLLKLQGAFLRNMTGRTATKRCIIIPVDDNPSIYLGDKGCYLNMSAWRQESSQYGDTHGVRPSLPKELLEKLSDDDKKMLTSYIGNMRPFGRVVEGTTNIEDPEDVAQDDLPF